MFLAPRCDVGIWILSKSWEFSGDSLGIFWDFCLLFLDFFGNLFFGDSLGIFWEFFGNSLGILLGFFGNSIGILWEFFGSFMSRQGNRKNLIIKTTHFEKDYLSQKLTKTT